MNIVLVFTLLGNIGMTIICWSWWLQPSTSSAGWFGALIFLIGQIIGCYEIGFKNLFKVDHKKAFYSIWFAPTFISIFGFALGLILGYR